MGGFVLRNALLLSALAVLTLILPVNAISPFAAATDSPQLPEPTSSPAGQQSLVAQTQNSVAAPSPTPSPVALQATSPSDEAASVANPSPPAESPPAPAPPPDIPTVSITNTGNLQTASGPALPVLITGSATATHGGALTGLPTLPRLPGAPITVSYPLPSVPPTANAPFMQRSSVPQGTFFIAVGAILGAFAIAILAWRGIIACLLHRSVARAAAAQRLASDKSAIFSPPIAPFYQYSDRRDSSPNLGRNARRPSRGTTASTSPSMTNLFFSPTAQSTANLPATATSGASAGFSLPSSRDSRYFAPGFYSSSANAATSSVLNLRPESPRHHRPTSSRITLSSPSPPDSPRPQLPRQVSTGSLGNYAPQPVRTPSAYLEDLLGDSPSAFPPQHIPIPRSADGRPSSYMPFRS